MTDDLRNLLEAIRQENAAAHVETRRHSEQVAADTRRHSEQLAADTRRQSEQLTADTRYHSEQLAAETRRHSEQVAAETRRHFEVVAERMEAKIDTVAEGVIAANERIDRLDAKVDALSSHIENEFNDVRSMIRFPHHELDRRLRMLEEVVADLQSRVERLESSTH